MKDLENELENNREALNAAIHTHGILQAELRALRDKYTSTEAELSIMRNRTSARDSDMQTETCNDQAPQDYIPEHESASDNDGQMSAAEGAIDTQQAPAEFVDSGIELIGEHDIEFTGLELVGTGCVTRYMQRKQWLIRYVGTTPLVCNDFKFPEEDAAVDECISMMDENGVYTTYAHTPGRTVVNRMRHFLGNADKVKRFKLIYIEAGMTNQGSWAMVQENPYFKKLELAIQLKDKTLKIDITRNIYRTFPLTKVSAVHFIHIINI